MPKSFKVQSNSIRGTITDFEPLLAVLNFGDDKTRKDVRTRVETVLQEGTILNWRGRKSQASELEADLVGIFLPWMDCSHKLRTSDVFSIEIKSSSSLENLAKGVAQSLIVPAILLWAAQSSGASGLTGFCAVIFGSKIQEEKLLKLEKGTAKLRHNTDSAQLEALKEGVSATRLLLTRGSMISLHDDNKSRVKDFKKALVDYAGKLGSASTDVPEAEVDPSNITKLFAPYEGVNQVEGNSVEETRLRAILSLLASIEVARSVGVELLHVQLCGPQV